MLYELRQIDAWNTDDGWTWNTSYFIKEYNAVGNDHKRAFLRALNKAGITCVQGSCYVSFDGSVYELRSIKTDEPYFAAIARY